MADTTVFKAPPASVEEIQQGWHELKLRVGQLEAERSVLEHENKALRFLLERVVEHRQKSHGELVLLLTSLVSKLPINDIGVVVSKLVEHNANVTEVCAALAKGKAETTLPQPALLRALDSTKRELQAALKPAIEDLIQSDPAFEVEMLRALIAKPELFFTPAYVRANRCFIKGQVPRERVLREFGEPALALFNDLTTDPKLNPRPKPEEIVMGFKPDFEALLAQNAAALGPKQAELAALNQRIQRSRQPGDAARAQRNAFLRMSFLLELLHYYENQATESPEGVFAQRLPALVELFVLANPQDNLDEKLIQQAEALLAYIINHDHRLMVINNVGKSGGSGRTLRYVLRFRAEKALDITLPLIGELVTEFVRHLIPASMLKYPAPETLLPILRLIDPALQKIFVRGVLHTDRIRKDDAETLAKALAKELNLSGIGEDAKTPTLAPEIERQIAWERVAELITRRVEPAAIATAIRERLHARYDAEEVKQSWVVLIEADVIAFIRAFCQLPYTADGRTDTIARPIMESYVTRLTHEKYAATYHKVVNSLRNMFKANPTSPTLLNFVNLVKWVDAAAASKLMADIGMAAPAQ